MINVIFESGMDEDKLPIDNLTKKELLERIRVLEKEAIKDNDVYTMTIEVL